MIATEWARAAAWRARISANGTSSRPGSRPGSSHDQCGSSSSTIEAKSRPPDLALDGDQVAGDLGGTPFAGGHRLALGGRRGGGRRSAGSRGTPRPARLGSRAGLLVDQVRREPALRLGERHALPGRVVGQLVATDPADPEVVALRVPEVVAGDRRRPATSRTIRSAGCRPATPPRAGRTASPSRCGRGRPDSRARAGCPGSARR